MFKYLIADLHKPSVEGLLFGSVVLEPNSHARASNCVHHFGVTAERHAPVPDCDFDLSSGLKGRGGSNVATTPAEVRGDGDYLFPGFRVYDANARSESVTKPGTLGVPNSVCRGEFLCQRASLIRSSSHPTYSK
jgi:hypothetical protein